MNGLNKEQKEVVEKGEKMASKHSLEYSWSFWFFENEKSRTWEENQREVFTFNTVEDFWCLFRNVKLPGELKVGCDYSFFKKGVRPMWEDEYNANGGRWVLNFDHQRKADANELWLNLLCYMLGENFGEYCEEICGATLNMKPRYSRITLWTRDCNRQLENIEIGKKMKECLNSKLQLPLNYESHESAEKKVTKNRVFMYNL